MKMNFSKLKVAAAVLCIVSAVSVVLANPGGTDDPLISKSYIDTVLMPQIKEYVESKITGGSSDGLQISSTFKVVELQSGDKLICGAGCELILRMGSATIIATEKGGLADTTAGYDLANGTSMPSNHLLIVPVADGRGIEATSTVLVMVKGEYEIK